MSNCDTLFIERRCLRMRLKLDRIKEFSAKVRGGEFTGYSGKKIKNTVVIGIGGSYLGPYFVTEALKNDPTCKEASEGRQIRFLSNVDPTDFYMAMEDLDYEETLFVVNSKTFTTAETMLNARTVKNALVTYYLEKYPEVDPKDFIKQHFVACSTNLTETDNFGID